MYKSITMYNATAGGTIVEGLLLGTANAGFDSAVFPITDTNGRCIGVALDTPAANLDPVLVAVAGIVKVTSGAAIAIGDQVAPDAAGKARTAASGQSMCGTALEAASGADEMVSILFGYQGQVVE